MEFSGVIISLLAFSAFTNGDRNSAGPPWPRPASVNPPQNFPPTNFKNFDSFFNNNPGFDSSFNNNPGFDPFINNNPGFDSFFNNPNFDPFPNTDSNFNRFSNNNPNSDRFNTNPNNFDRVNNPSPPGFNFHTSPSKNSQSHKIPSSPNSRRNHASRKHLPPTLSPSPIHRPSSSSPIHTGGHPSSPTVHSPSGAPPALPTDHTSIGGPSDSSAPHVSSGGPPDPSDGPSEHKDSHSSEDKASNHESHASAGPNDSNTCCHSNLKLCHKIVCIFNVRHHYRSGFRPAYIDSCLCTHLNYEFGMLDPNTYEMIPGEPDLDIQENFFEEAIDLKKLNPELKVLMSLGGWDDSTKKYSEMAESPQLRNNFIVKTLEFLKKHRFDGLDFAWEYPNCWQGALGISPKDKANFVVLLKEIKQEFVKHGLLLSISVGSIKREVEAAYDVPEINKSVDYINVMTYDMHGPWEHTTGHHTQFKKLEGDDDPYCNVKSAMELWVQMGADKCKLNMGIAMYGKSYALKDSAHCVLGAPAEGPGCPGPRSKNGGFLMYNEICEGLNAGNWTEYEFPHSGFCACNNEDMVCYDSPIMMVRKAKFVCEHDYGGVLLKDLSGDDFKGKCFNLPFPLVKICRMEIIKACESKNKTENSH